MRNVLTLTDVFMRLVRKFRGDAVRYFGDYEPRVRKIQIESGLVDSHPEYSIPSLLTDNTNPGYLYEALITIKRLANL